jgi:hypothetical protein
MRSGGKMQRLIGRKQEGREKTVMAKQIRAFLQHFVVNGPTIEETFVVGLCFRKKNYYKIIGLLFMR